MLSECSHFRCCGPSLSPAEKNKALDCSSKIKRLTVSLYIAGPHTPLAIIATQKKEAQTRSPLLRSLFYVFSLSLLSVLVLEHRNSGCLRQVHVEWTNKSFCGLKRQRTHSLRQVLPFAEIHFVKWLRMPSLKGCAAPRHFWGAFIRCSCWFCSVWREIQSRNCIEICPLAQIKEHFKSYTVHTWNIHKALIASLIIYKWVIKHLESLYQGNPAVHCCY